MELRDYLRGLRRHWLSIVMMTLLGVAASYGWVLTQTSVYEATSSGYVQSRSTEDVGGSIVGDQLARSKVASYLDAASWRIVAQYAIDELGLDTTADEIVHQVTVTNVPDTVILQVAARGATPAEARDLAEVWTRGMAAAIDGIEGDGTPGSSPVTILPIDTAGLPTSPIFPDLRTSLMVGGALGLGFGIAFALIRTAADRRIRSAADVESRTNVAVVGAIPMTPALADQGVLLTSDSKSGSFAASEALRALRTNLQFMDVDNPPRTIVITSPLPGDGKSTIACNLAYALAVSGQPVVLVDGDLRRSKVAEVMGLPGAVGLSDVLSGRAELAEVMQRTPLSSNLFVLAAGSTPPNPSEVLGSARMRDLLTDLAAHATVIIDAPPLLAVTDGAVLTHQADGALVVVSVGKTTFDLVEHALATLGKANGRTLGVVLNKIPRRGADSSPYSYDYRRSYGDASSSSPAADIDVERVVFEAPEVAVASGDTSAPEPARQRPRRA